LATVISDPALYKLLTYHIPKRMSLFIRIYIYATRIFLRFYELSVFKNRVTLLPFFEISLNKYNSEQSTNLIFIFVNSLATNIKLMQCTFWKKNLLPFVGQFLWIFNATTIVPKMKTCDSLWRL
jgi:hypothetical protein